jgi:hypothetical protein
MSISRKLFFDGCNLKTHIDDAINKYSKVRGASPISKKGDVIKQLGKDVYNLIVLAGHGCKNEISTGSGMGRALEPTQEITLDNFKKSEAFFKDHLIKHFPHSKSEPSILFLAGCEICDVREDENPLLAKISSILRNVIVIAPGALVKPEIREGDLKMKFESKPGIKTSFDFDLTLSAYQNGKRITDMDQMLKLTRCNEVKELRDLLCKWEKV